MKLCSNMIFCVDVNDSSATFEINRMSKLNKNCWKSFLMIWSLAKNVWICCFNAYVVCWTRKRVNIIFVSTTRCFKEMILFCNISMLSNSMTTTSRKWDFSFYSNVIIFRFESRMCILLNSLSLISFKMRFRLSIIIYYISNLFLRKIKRLKLWNQLR